jgi:POT family proton-dependent oligopeptide transporter
MATIGKQANIDGHGHSRRSSLASHPAGLFALFSVEAWERFSFYGMRALLILFMTSPASAGGLGWGVATAGAVYGLFTASVYLLSLPGGWIADKLIGQRAAVLWGGFLIAAGNILAALPAGLFPFVAGLATIAAGVGLLKPNVSVMVGQLYDGDTPARRDAGFSIFYFGIYLGAFTSPLVAGTMGETFGYRWGFALTGAAMLLGTIMFARARRRLVDVGLAPVADRPAAQHRSWLGLVAATLATVATGLALARSGVAVGAVATGLGVVIGGAFIGYFLYMILGAGLSAAERRNVVVIMLLCLCVVLFTAGLEQAGSTMNLFARDFTDRSLLGGYFDAGLHPATWYQSVAPCFVLLLSPLFAFLWLRLATLRLDPSTPAKFALSLMVLGLSFAVMAIAVQMTVIAGFKAAPEWLVAVYFLQTVAELCISPIGLAAVTKLSPRSHGGQMMGMWFLATAAGSLAAGLLGGWIGSGTMAEMPGQFLAMAGVGVAAGVAMMLASPLIRRLARAD